MMPLRNRLFAALAMIGFAVVCTGLGVALSNANDGKAPDLMELRDAVNTAAKRGDNVEEIRRALDNLEKSLSGGWSAPEAGKMREAPAELLALHDAVESAARKGENVEEIRKHLEAVEKNLIGKTINKPKPVVPRPLPQPDPFELPPRPNFPGQALPMPVFPGADPVDREAMRKAQELTRKATELLLKNPDDPEAQRIMLEAHEIMLKAMLGGGGMFNPGFNNLNLPNFGRGPIPERFRLGVRLERVSELAADQLGLEVARGVGISDVVEGSAAAKAGFKTHDIVLEFAGKPVSDNPEDFTRLVASVKGAGKVDAVVLRKGKRIEIKGIEMPEVPQEFPRLNALGGQQLPEGRQAGGGRLLGPPAAGANGNGRLNSISSMSVSDVNGQVTIKALQDGINYEIRGERNGAEVTIKNMIITDGDKKTEAEKLDKVPEEFRPTVERLIKSLNNKIRP